MTVFWIKLKFWTGNVRKFWHYLVARYSIYKKTYIYAWRVYLNLLTYEFFFPCIVSKNLVFYVGKIDIRVVSESYYQPFIALLSSYKIKVDLNSRKHYNKTGDCFSDHGPNMDLFKNLRKVFFLDVSDKK